MASTSSLEFFGLTLSCCWTGFSWLFWVCSEGGAILVGSCVGGGLCAKAVLGANAPIKNNLLVCRRTSCLMPTSDVPLYTQNGAQTWDRRFARIKDYDVRSGAKVS